MLSNDGINQIIEALKSKGFEIRVRDISYVVLCNSFEDYNVAYKIVWGEASDVEVEAYNNHKKIQELRNYMFENMLLLNGPGEEEDITYEENKAYMLKIKRETEKLMRSNQMPKHIGIKILADITKSLNDKFGIADATRDQIVVVNNKYNDICPRCGTEVSARPMSKEEAMEKYNLKEK